MEVVGDEVEVFLGDVGVVSVGGGVGFVFVYDEVDDFGVGDGVWGDGVDEGLEVGVVVWGEDEDFVGVWYFGVCVCVVMWGSVGEGLMVGLRVRFFEGLCFWV